MADNSGRVFVRIEGVRLERKAAVEAPCYVSVRPRLVDGSCGSLGGDDAAELPVLRAGVSLKDERATSSGGVSLHTVAVQPPSAADAQGEGGEDASARTPEDAGLVQNMGNVLNLRTTFFALNPATLSRVGNSRLVVDVLQHQEEGLPESENGVGEESGEPEGVQVLGRASVDLADLFAAPSGQAVCTRPLGQRPPQAQSSDAAADGEGGAEDAAEEQDTSEGLLAWGGANSTVSCSLSLDDDVAEYVRGGTFITLSNAALDRVPSAWDPDYVPGEEEDGGDVPEGADGDRLVRPNTMYELTLPSQQDQAGKDSALKFSLSHSEGVLVFVDYTAEERAEIEAAEAEAARKAAEARGGEDGDADAAAAGEDDDAPPRRRGKWTLQWEPTTASATRRVFLHRDIVAALSTRLSSQKTTTIACEVHQVKQLPPPEDASDEDSPDAAREQRTTAQCQVVVAALVEPGRVEATFSGTFVDPTATGKSSSEDGGEEEKGEDEENQSAIQEPQAPREVGLTFGLRLSKPLVEEHKPALSQTLRPADLISYRGHDKRVNPRDLELELRQEISGVITEIATEYVCMYPTPGAAKNVHREDKRVRMLEHLTSSGVLHNFKEQLRPRLQRVVRSKFRRPDGAAPGERMGVAEQEELIGRVFVYAMDQVTLALTAQFKETAITVEAERLRDATSIPDEEETFPQMLERTARLALDAEAQESWQVVSDVHRDRVQQAEDANKAGAATDIQVHDTWLEYMQAYLRQPRACPLDGQALASAVEMCKEALGRCDACVSSTSLCGALLLESDIPDQAAAMLTHATELASAAADGSSAVPCASRRELPVAGIGTLPWTLRVLLHSARDEQVDVRQALRTAVECRRDAAPQVDEGVPRRTAVTVLLECASFLLDHSLYRLAERALDMAQACEEAAAEKADERGLSTETPPFHKELHSRCRARLALARGDIGGALKLAQAATDSLPTSASAWIVRGDVEFAKSSVEDSLDSYKTALEQLESAFATLSPEEQAIVENRPPLRVFVRIGKLCRQQSLHEEALEVYLRGSRYHSVGGMWIGAGVCCLRLEKLIEAEDALQEAHLLDNRNPEVWAYSSLLCLTCGEHRKDQAIHALDQALRFGLRDPALLRELATLWMSIDEMQRAELLLRRSIELDPNPIAKRLLADVLSAQNM